MARILAVSSFLAHGTIGLMANAAALRILGHQVLQFPTVILSNHPGHAHSAGERVPAAQLAKMLDAIEANGWLENVSAVLTGYLPTRSHVDFADDILERVHRHSPAAFYVCDPIIGDDPMGVYVEETAAGALRSILVPVADVLTPNRFELSWLSGKAVKGVESAISAAAALACKAVAATSIPGGANESNELCNVLAAPGVTQALASPRRERVPHGAGDVFCGLLTGLLARGQRLPVAFHESDRLVREVVAYSSGWDDLELAPLTQIT